MANKKLEELTKISSLTTGTKFYVVDSLNNSYHAVANQLATYLISNHDIVSGQNYMLFDGFGVVSENYNARLLLDYAALASVDWNGRILYDIAGKVSVDWLNRTIKDSSEQISIDYNGRELIKADGTASIEWENSETKDSLGNTSINWSDRVLFDSNGLDCLYWEDKWLQNDYGIAIDWKNQILKTGVFTTLNWGTRTLSGNWNAESLSIAGNQILYINPSTTVYRSGDQNISGIKTFLGTGRFYKIINSGIMENGQLCTGQGAYSHAEGYSNIAVGIYSHVEGINNNAFNAYSHAEGSSTRSVGDTSHSEGILSISSGNWSHVEGLSCVSLGDYSHAEGSSTRAHTNGSHSAGLGTIASGGTQNVVGNYNSVDSSALFIIGNGTSNSSRSNIFKALSSSIEVSGITNSESGRFHKTLYLPISTNAPSTSTSIGTQGQIATSGAFLFIATGTNQWGRIALSNF